MPGLRTRFVETAVELRAGQTLALAGLLQMRTESQSVGLPFLADIPYAGALFRANREVQNEVELLITVTPDFAAPMDACEVPPGGPGFNSQSPSDKELYWKSYLEVPTHVNQEAAHPTEFLADTSLTLALRHQASSQLPWFHNPTWVNGMNQLQLALAIHHKHYTQIGV